MSLSGRATEIRVVGSVKVYDVEEGLARIRSGCFVSQSTGAVVGLQ